MFIERLNIFELVIVDTLSLRGRFWNLEMYDKLPTMCHEKYLQTYVTLETRTAAYNLPSFYQWTPYNSFSV